MYNFIKSVSHVSETMAQAITSASDEISKQLVGHIEKTSMVISESVKHSSQDEQKIAQDWNNVGNDMRKALLKYDREFIK